MRGLLIVAEMPLRFWMVAACLLFTGCSVTPVALGQLDLTSFAGSIPGILAALVSIAKAYEMRLKSEAAINMAEVANQRAIQEAAAKRDEEHAECKGQLDALAEEFRRFREEAISQRSHR